MESSNEFLGTERIGKLMQKYAIPCIISLLVGALYNIVDQIFIANASYLGSYGNAANTVVFPLTVVALAIAVMIGDGCCAFVSISLGQERSPQGKAERWQRSGDVSGQQHRSDRCVSDLCKYHSRHVRRNGQRRDLSSFPGIFLLHHAGYTPFICSGRP